jgi:hypothetical protein
LSSQVVIYLRYNPCSLLLCEELIQNRNSFLDAFAQYRNGLGLPASVVDMGAVEDVGWISEHQGMMGKMSRSGFKPVLEQEVINAMAVSMLVHNRPGKALESGLTLPSNDASKFVHKNTFLVGLALLIPLHDPSNYVIWKKDRRMTSYHNNSTVAATAALDGLAKDLPKQRSSRPLASQDIRGKQPICDGNRQKALRSAAQAARGSQDWHAPG